VTVSDRSGATTEKQSAIDVLVKQMGYARSTRGHNFGSMDRRTRLSGRYAMRKEGSGRDDAKCHPERSVHELCEETNSNQSEKFRCHGAGSFTPIFYSWRGSTWHKSLILLAAR
jgi:hypothetical protein